TPLRPSSSSSVAVFRSSLEALVAVLVFAPLAAPVAAPPAAAPPAVTPLPAAPVPAAPAPPALIVTRGATLATALFHSPAPPRARARPPADNLLARRLAHSGERF